MESSFSSSSSSRDRSVAGHSVTVRKTIYVSSSQISGATTFEVSGTPADCVSLALLGELFSWSKPALVVNGINRGSSSVYKGLLSYFKRVLFIKASRSCCTVLAARHRSPILRPVKNIGFHPFTP
ncbi:unnamed protein product [Prunus armeniaca]|uniref:Survival protein SurE-like phosphatase/nucleotidase domain-containing protein n=1 Tax=Prunus armeniaca TaxID=36596 RepID=A0A6J5TY14_PRUAR|nr:unnamed protein product [Prunus armeniaca]CAB4299012.1 unnamed protein product [Prunus armeniaca]